MSHSFEELKRAATYSFMQGKIQDAFDVCCIALKKPEADHFIKLLFAQTFADAFILNYNPVIKNAIFLTIQEEGVECQKLMSGWLFMLRADTAFAPLFELPPVGETLTAVQWSALQDVFVDPYFTTGLQKFIVTNSELENVSISLRRIMLMQMWPEKTLKTKHLAFICALAELCFTNEYLYPVSDKEAVIVAALPRDDAVAVSLRGCYEGLHGQEISAKLSAVAAFKSMMTLLVKNPEREAVMRPAFKHLGEVDDAVSQGVSAMYEANPYPRWRHVDIPLQQIPLEGADVLIAGCGTGKYLTQISATLNDANITAIDFSRTSLAYARRQAADYGYENIDYYHCDILNLHYIGKNFDYINCTGVLHHMKDPQAGWQKLIDQLKAGGMMMIALYSTKGRIIIEEARQYVREKGYLPTIDGIRMFRRDVFAMPAGHRFKRFLTFKDFYSVSDLRDLVFHIQETTYDIQTLKRIMDDLELEFKGMIVPYRLISNDYRARYPDDPEMVNLNNWDEMEHEIPDMFGAMYNFICMRKGETPNEVVKKMIQTGLFASI